MAVDKLVDSAQLESDLTDIADAIRAKTGGTADLAFPADFVSEIGSISGGGGYTAADFTDFTKPTGRVEFNQVAFNINSQPFACRTGITELYGPNYNNTANHTGIFREMTNLQYAVFPKATRFYNACFYGCSKLEAIDWFGGGTGGTMIWTNCPKLTTMVIRKSNGISALASNNAFNNTPFRSGGAGGTIYIPKVLYDELGTGSSLDYKAATNWATYDAYGTITWAQIEGSIYETQYADGTPIPTT